MIDFGDVSGEKLAADRNGRVFGMVGQWVEPTGPSIPGFCSIKQLGVLLPLDGMVVHCRLIAFLVSIYNHG
jgi:hypothetical protein